MEEHLRRLERRRVLGRDLPVLLRLQPRQQLEPRPDRHARATQGVRPRGLRTGADDVQPQPRPGLALHVRCRTLPSVAPPPAKFKIDPYYTKFTWAREFTVLGRGASDEALLKANDTIRKMFAYRHDILKALIADGVKLVVLGRGERLADLPEFPALEASPGVRSALARARLHAGIETPGRRRGKRPGRPRRPERRRQPGDPDARPRALSRDRHAAGRSKLGQSRAGRAAIRAARPAARRSFR